MEALQAAHRASDEYYTSRHTEAWDTSFVITPAAIQHDMQLLQDLEYEFVRMCKFKQSKLAHNRLSIARIDAIFRASGDKIPGVDPADILILREFATARIVYLL